LVDVVVVTVDVSAFVVVAVVVETAGVVLVVVVVDDEPPPPPGRVVAVIVDVVLAPFVPVVPAVVVASDVVAVVLLPAVVVVDAVELLVLPIAVVVAMVAAVEDGHHPMPALLDALLPPFFDPLPPFPPLLALPRWPPPSLQVGLSSSGPCPIHEPPRPREFRSRLRRRSTLWMPPPLVEDESPDATIAAGAVSRTTKQRQMLATFIIDYSSLCFFFV